MILRLFFLFPRKWSRTGIGDKCCRKAKPVDYGSFMSCNMKNADFLSLTLSIGILALKCTKSQGDKKIIS